MSTSEIFKNFGFYSAGERGVQSRRVAELCRRAARGLHDGPIGLALTLAALSGPGQRWDLKNFEASMGQDTRPDTQHDTQYDNQAQARDDRNPPNDRRPPGLTLKPTEDTFESLVARKTEAILKRVSGRPATPQNAAKPGNTLELAAGILAACHEFDEAVEFSACGLTSISAAIGEFYTDAHLRFQPEVVTALRRVTTPRWQPSLTGHLSSLPTAAPRLMALSDENTSVMELEEIASADPILAGRLLGAANSASFGSGSSIVSLQQAIQRIGIPRARRVLVGSCVGRMFGSGGLVDLWKHSQTVATTAQNLAARCGGDPEAAWTAGLLHDVGRIVIEKAPPAVLSEEQMFVAAGFPLGYAESLVYGKDHAALGGELLESWEVPNEIVDAVRFHHRPEATDSMLAGILFLAEDAAEAGQSGDPSREMRLSAAAANTGLERATYAIDHSISVGKGMADARPKTFAAS